MTSLVSAAQSNPFDVSEKDLKVNDVDTSLTVIDVQANKHCSAALLEPERPSGLSNQRISDPFSEGSIADRVKQRQRGGTKRKTCDPDHEAALLSDPHGKPLEVSPE